MWLEPSTIALRAVRDPQGPHAVVAERDGRVVVDRRGHAHVGQLLGRCGAAAVDRVVGPCADGSPGLGHLIPQRISDRRPPRRAVERGHGRRHRERELLGTRRLARGGRDQRVGDHALFHVLQRLQQPVARGRHAEGSRNPLGAEQHPRRRLLAPVAGEVPPRGLEVVQAGGDLLDVIAALNHAGRFAGGLDRRQQERDEDADNGDHDQQFDKREGRGKQSDGVNAIHLVGLAAAEAGVFEHVLHCWNIPSSSGVDCFQVSYCTLGLGGRYGIRDILETCSPSFQPRTTSRNEEPAVANSRTVACLGDAVQWPGTVERASTSLAYRANSGERDMTDRLLICLTADRLS